MYHISDIKQFISCPKKYILNKESNKTYFNFFRNEFNIVDIYKEVFNIEECFVGQTGDNPSLVLDNLDNYDYFINARFATSNLRVKASLLHKELDGFSLYFFKPMLPKELDINSIYITYDVLKRNGINVTNIYLISVDREYVLEDKIDFKKTLIISDKFDDTSIIETIENYSFDYDSAIKSIENYKDDSKYSLDKHCSSCEHFNTCFKDTLTNDSIMHLVSSKFKHDMYLEGRKRLMDVDLSRIDGTSLQYAQILANRNNGMFVDKQRLKEFMDSFKSDVISFIDFEWDCFLFPIYKKMNCFGLLPFEFSLYVKNKDRLTNYTYVGKGDCRKEFIETLIVKLPNNGPIVAYNSFSAEVLRLEELAKQFPEYKDKLNSIAKRFVDIAEVFSKGMVYDIRFKGQLSLKNIDSVISNISYKELDVKDGLEAVLNFRRYESSNDENIKDALVKYCNQDAYSLVIIYDYLKNMI